MNKVEKLLVEYGESHQNKTNILIHKFCVPLILFSIIGFLTLIPGDFKGIATELYIMAIFALYYLILSLRYSLIILPIILIMYFINLYLEQSGYLLLISVIIFVISWIFQFIGHKIEGKKPSFLKDLQFLLIGPLWTINKLFNY